VLFEHECVLSVGEGAVLARGGGGGYSLLACNIPRVPVFLIQFAKELGSQSREEKVGECLPDGFCCSMHESLCIV
jgi:hypothetical protein